MCNLEKINLCVIKILELTFEWGLTCVKEGYHIPNIASMPADPDFFVRSQYSKKNLFAVNAPTIWSGLQYIQMSMKIKIFQMTNFNFNLLGCFKALYERRILHWQNRKYASRPRNFLFGVNSPELFCSKSIVQDFFVHSQHSIWWSLALSGCTQSIFQVCSGNI